MYDAFALVLMVNHACNLRCSYCYTGAKFSRPMPESVARAAVDRAISSLRSLGHLELGFFGGEPLIEAPLIASIIDYARTRAAARNLRLSFSMTTNGTCVDPVAWRVMTDPHMDLSVSHDGLPAVHDRHRVGLDGRGTSTSVEQTLRKLVAAGRDFGVVIVVRPDTLASLLDGVRYLRGIGVRRVEPSLDLWTKWSADDIERLRGVTAACADIWRAALPDFAMSWFDEKVARIAGVPIDEGARCGFGDGQIAVAPSGNLYPCERLIGEDGAGHPMRLPGSALEEGDFLRYRAAPKPMRTEYCGTNCRCSNYVRTGAPETADDLLRAFDRICFEETLRVIGRPVTESRGSR